MLKPSSEEIQQSLDVLDRVLSEFDDVETDTHDESTAHEDVCPSGEEEEDGEEENHDPALATKTRSRPPGVPPPPPPIDRSLKPKKGGGGGGRGGEPVMMESKAGELPPALPSKRRSRPRSQEGSTGSSPSETSHEYQEINSDLGALHRPSPPLQGSSVTREIRRHLSEDRTRQRRLEEADGRDRPRRQRSEDGMLSYNSMDVRTLDVPKTRHRGDLRPITREARLEQWEEARHRGDSHEARHMKKSRSSDMTNLDWRSSSRGDDERRESQGRHGQRRSRSSDRWLESQEEYFDPHMDLRGVDPRLVDPRLLDPRMMDPRYTPEEIMGFPMQDPRFPHLLSYPSPQHPGPGISPGVLPTGALSPIPPGPPSFQSREYPGYPMYPYEMGYPPDLMLPPEHMIGQPGMEHPPALIPPHHFYPPHPDFVPLGDLPPDFPLPLPPQHQHLPGYPPGDYAVDFPYPGMMGGMWGVDNREREEWPPPTPEEAKRLIHKVVRTQGRNGYESERCIPDPCPMRPAADSSRASKRHVKEQQQQQQQQQQQKQQLKKKQQTLQPRSSRRPGFKAGEAVQDHQVKNSATLPHLSGKDNDFEEVPGIDDGRGSRVGGAFIVTGVFNDTSNMYIPAPPSPTPDYDDDEESDSDGDTSDILRGSQFYVVSNDSETGKKTASRDSLSEDSLQGTPNVNQKKKISGSPESVTPLQNMMREFHQGLPPPAGRRGDEEHFSDDSLEGSHHHPRSSSIAQKPKRINSLESLASMGSSTVSFDYMNAGQVRKLSDGKTRQGHVIPSNYSSSVQRNTNKKDKKDWNVKKSFSNVEEGGIKGVAKSPVDGPKSSSRRANTQNAQTSEAPKRTEKFNTIRKMLKDGLIEGLDESPPDFKPPPPSAKSSMKTTSGEERADSGIGSTVSASKTDDSGNSDNHSDHSSSPSPGAVPGQDQLKKKESPAGNKPVSISSLRPATSRDTLSSKGSTTSEGTERNRLGEDEVEMIMEDDLTPPTPPVRVQSKESKPSMPRNSNWLHTSNNSALSDNRNHRPAPPPPPHSSSMLEQMEVLEADATSKASRHHTDKITHVDDIYGQSEAPGTISSAINGNLTARYPEEESTADHDNPLTDREFLENLKNLESRPRPDSLTVISEPGDDRGSLGSRGSRSGRFLSRLTDTMKNTSKSSSPSSTSSSRATTTKLTSTSRGSTRIHGDIIRDPLQGSFREGSLISPQDYQRLPPPSPGSVPLNRDSTGRYRSSEDLADTATASSSPGLETCANKKKKHSTLPPSLTPADMRKENKELRRATSLMCGKKTKDESEGGSKFRFNVFRGLWRRKQYSFDNKL